MDFFTSGMRAGFYIAGSIIGFTALVTSVWFTGCYVGRPLGATIVQIVGVPNDTEQAPPTTLSAQAPQRSHAERVHRPARILGGLVALMLCFFAVTLDATLNEIGDTGSRRVPLSLGMLGMVVLKGCFEGIVALTVLSAVVRVLKLG